MNGKDPITLYMKDVLPLDETVKEIRKMAVTANMEPKDYLKLLLNQFLNQITSLQEEEVKKGEPEKDEVTNKTANNFPLKEVVGEISLDFYKYVTQQTSEYKIDDLRVIKKSADKLIEDLQTAIEAPVDEKLKGNDPTDLVIPFIEEMTGQTENAQALYVKLMDHLALMAPQVTVEVDKWFDAFGLKTTSTMYNSILGIQHTEEKASDIIRPGIEGTVDTLGRKGEGALKDMLSEKGRGPRYMRWRMDKDNRAEGLDLPLNVYPIYGCLNYWDAKWYCGDSSYYGNVHFLLKQKVKEKKKCFYKYKDSGIKRNSLIGLFNDLVKRDKDKAAIIFGNLMKAVVTAEPRTDIEVVIPGGFNLLTDVEKIFVTQDVKPEITKAISKWAKKHNIACVASTTDTGMWIESQDNVTQGIPVDKVKGIISRRQELVENIRAKVIDDAWDSMGFGKKTKTPNGIKQMRKFLEQTDKGDFETLEGLARIASKHKGFTKKKGTKNFYKIVSNIQTNLATEMFRSIEQLNQLVIK